MTEPVSGSTLSAEPAPILVTATVVLATAAVLGLESVNSRANRGANSLQSHRTLQLCFINWTGTRQYVGVVCSSGRSHKLHMLH